MREQKLNSLIQSGMVSIMKLNTYKKIAFLALIFLLIILAFFVGLKKYQKPIIELEQVSSNAQKSDEFPLTGHIVYRQNRSIVSYDLNSKKTSILLPELTDTDNFNEWKYANGYVFALTGTHEITRLNVATSEQIKLTFNPADCFTHPQANSFCDIARIIPSPDGNQLVIFLDSGSGARNDMLAPSEAMRVVFIKNYEKNSLQKIKNTLALDFKWFNNNRFAYLGNKTVLDTFTLQQKYISDLTSNTIYPSFTGNRYLWFDEAMKAKDRGIFEISRPNLVNSSLVKTFPQLKDVGYNPSDFGISFLQFPVVARDFKGITNVIPILDFYTYLLEIDSGGKKDIFLTDSSGTFKKITPNNSDSYRLLTYLPSSHQIIAIRSKEDRSYGIKILESNLVLLDESNYAEFVANIDNGSSVYKEKTILKFSDPSFIGYILNKYSISPDEKYLLLPLSQKGLNYGDYTIVDMTNGTVQKLDVNLGNNFVWLK